MASRLGRNSYGRAISSMGVPRAFGAGNATIMIRHLLPNAMVATLTFAPFILSGSIKTPTTLDS